MIIKRKYVYFMDLVNRDPKGAEVYKEACYYNHDNKEGQRIFDLNLQYRLFETDIESGINGQAYVEMNKRFDELDNTDPYDNGFNLNDINKIEILNRSVHDLFTGEEELPRWIDVAYYCVFDGYERIVKVERVFE